MGSQGVAGYQYHTYSITEGVIGEWSDGKPVYEKTIFSMIPYKTTDCQLVNSNPIVTSSDLKRAICVQKSFLSFLVERAKQ